MCGIVGYIGPKNVTEVLVDGLRRLEYRGYDSAGIAVVRDGSIEIRRCAGKLRNLEQVLSRQPVSGSYGIAHTRWATHGRPSEENAHPHRDCSSSVVVIHNGIIENYLHLKRSLASSGHRFATETDTEVYAHMVEANLRSGLTLEESVRLALGEITTRDMVFLDDGEVAVITRDNVLLTDSKGGPRPLRSQSISWDPLLAEKGGYRHFMLKEIHEQPRAIRDTLYGRIWLDRGTVDLGPMELSEKDFQTASRAIIVACGTSWHAALAGKFMIERLARIPVEVDYGSEYRYRKAVVTQDTLHVFVTQSGETADTIAALREAKALGAKCLSICNVVGSMATRESHGVIYTHAGPEIGVASTKAFATQLVALYLLALHLARCRGALSEEEIRSHVQSLAHLPAQIEHVLKTEGEIEALAKRLFHATDFLYLGRGINYPIALEGALKLKEISYIHAEGYPAGEMKHGPIALIDEHMPVVALAVRDSVYEKMVSNIEEVKARLGVVIALTSEGNNELDGKADHTIKVPAASDLVTPAILVVPLQLLAYHIALLRGCDVDQPRNLAKSVTVE
ncbi:MAG: glutamine--fructose-6-phosphate transaminase (isomerizing) [Acidobacteria bacterium]|nr:MAG: glutamine--fructose-6-phosphate transaminase (isomerizing) [Acidobacteriota bacterium]